MNEDNNNFLAYLFWGGVGVYVVWSLFFKNTQEPTYIQEEFNNGRTIDMEVDDTITKDNWECTNDCSGHDAGYAWAEEQGISDPSDCGGRSESFIEGCEAYANEN